MVTHKVVEVHAYNVEDPAAAVCVVERPAPEPGQGEVLVKVLLRPVNPADLFSVQGVYPGFTPEQLPAVPGLDGVAEVVRNGPGTKGTFSSGQRVVATPWATQKGHGSWQQLVAIPEGQLMAVAQGLSDEVASQFFVNPVTAVGFFDELQVPKGEWLLNNAATSALGRMVISLAKHKGVKTINLVRRREAVDDLKALGADEVLVLGEDDISTRVRDITGGRGAYAALEPVGGEVTKQVTASVRYSGTCLIYGAMAAFESTFAIPDLLFRDVRLHGFWLSTWLKAKDAATRHRVLEEVADAIRATQRPGRGEKVFLEG